MHNRIFWYQMAERFEVFTCGICRHSLLHGVEKKSKSQEDLILHLFLYVLLCDSGLVRTGNTPTSNSEELLQRSEYLLIFIKFSKGWILTVIYILCIALSLRIDLIQRSLHICKVFLTQLFLKLVMKFSLFSFAVEYCTDCVLNLGELLVCQSHFLFYFRNLGFSKFLLTQSQVPSVELWYICMMVRLHRTCLCCLFNLQSVLQWSTSDFWSSKLLIVSVLSSQFSQL